MPSAVTNEEITQLIQGMNLYREQVTKNPKEAKRVLYAVGIHTRKGTLKKPYRK